MNSLSLCRFDAPPNRDEAVLRLNSKWSHRIILEVSWADRRVSQGGKKPDWTELEVDMWVLTGGPCLCKENGGF